MAAPSAPESTAVPQAAAEDVVRYPVAPGVRLNVRTGPGSQYRLIRTLPYNVKVPVYCQKPGETVTGTYGTTNLWDNIADGEFVSDAYVNTGSDGYVAPRCS
ncbi:SH3 domain-containing protein [Streptomyces sp. NPDC002133]|uniref:SH3 domain-containing protein n=1 Tax=Streptomyces sp. NPDC002133 TaxID=3154409 RepID=UPI003328F2F9